MSTDDPSAMSPVAEPTGNAGETARPLGRRWRRIARSPFGGSYNPHVWTGSEMLVVQGHSGRLASYDPANDSWTERKGAPRPLESFLPSVWTGSELVIQEVDAKSLGGLAYAPASDTWRELQRSPLRMDDGLSDATWTGSRLVVLDGARNVAAYDPVADCWDQLPQLSGDRSGSHVYWSGSALLGETRRRFAEEGLSIATYDPVAGAWGEPVPSPLLQDTRINSPRVSRSPGRLGCVHLHPARGTRPQTPPRVSECHRRGCQRGCQSSLLTPPATFRSTSSMVSPCSRSRSGCPTLRPNRLFRPRSLPHRQRTPRTAPSRHRCGCCLPPQPPSQPESTRRWRGHPSPAVSSRRRC